jgi:hypothetical protein
MTDLWAMQEQELAFRRRLTAGLPRLDWAFPHGIEYVYNFPSIPGSYLTRPRKAAVARVMTRMASWVPLSWMAD